MVVFPARARTARGSGVRGGIRALPRGAAPCRGDCAARIGLSPGDNTVVAVGGEASRTPSAGGHATTGESPRLCLIARRAAANAGPGDGVAAVVASTTVARLASCSCWPPSSAAATNSFARPPCCPRSCCCPFSIASSSSPSSGCCPIRASVPSVDATPGLATTVEVTHAGWRTRVGGVGASLRAAATPPVCDPPSDGGTVNVAHEGCTTCTAGLAGTTDGCSGPQLTRRGV